jgi:thiol-disulfide isomerase/thioredoxin
MYYINRTDFEIINKKVLLKEIKGVSLIFFFSPKCIHCKTIFKIFHKVEQYFSNKKYPINFFYFNVSQDVHFLQTLNQNKTDLQVSFVPYIVSYKDKNLANEYSINEENPQKNYENLISFIMYLFEKNNEDIIPQYSFGKPKSSKRKNICTLDEAYKIKN